VHTYPRGYPNLATFLDSDENFSIYRRFGYLQARLLLDKQDELRLLEEELECMERSTDLALLSSTVLSGGYAERRRELFSRIETKFNEYGSLMPQHLWANAD
jgi:hypothetical protein